MLTVLYIVIGIILVLIVWSFIEQKLFITTSYSVKSDKLPKAFDSTNFVVLSDLHNHSFGKNNDRLIKQIDQISPAFILVSGDMINKKMVCYPSSAYALLSQLAKKYKIYYGYGNHEQRFEDLNMAEETTRNSITTTWVEYRDKLQNQGITFLNNQHITIEKNGYRLRITGLSVDSRYFKHGKLHEMDEEYLSSLLGIKQADSYEILIAHHPSFFENYVSWGADLTISGHIHGGLVRLPFLGGVVSPQVRLFPKYSFGLYSKENCSMIVSRGLGSHSLMPRLFNVPEIVQIRLNRKVSQK